MNTEVPDMTFSVYYCEARQQFKADLGASTCAEAHDFIDQMDSKVFDKVQALADQIAHILGREMEALIKEEEREYWDREFYEKSL
jgi:hypothetical protein